MIYLIIDLFIKITIIQIIAVCSIKLMYKFNASIKYQVIRLSLILMLIVPLASNIINNSKIVVFESNEPTLELFKADILLPVGSKENEHKIDEPLLVDGLKAKKNESFLYPYLKGYSNFTLFIFIYSTIVIILSLRLIYGLFNLKRLKKSPVNIENLNVINQQLNIKWNAEIYSSSDLISPMTWGVIRPKILLPSTYVTWDKIKLHMTIMHETIHIKRFDFFVNILGNILAILFWVSPISSLFYRALKAEQEASCDETVLNFYNRKSDYATHLITLAKLINNRNRTLKVGVFMINKNQLSQRIKNILYPKLKLSSRKKIGVLSPILFISILISMSFKTINFKEIDLNQTSRVNHNSDDKKNEVFNEDDEFKPNIFPIALVKYNFTALFGKKIKPFEKEYIHKGLDIACAKGTDVIATASGKINLAKDNGDYGLQIVIHHVKPNNAQDYITRYSHLSKITVSSGQYVKKGDKIGEVGSTGKSTNPHLHYEIEYQGKLVNPQTYLPINTK